MKNNYQRFLTAFFCLCMILPLHSSAKIKIDEINKAIKQKKLNWTAAENKFTQMSAEERQQLLGMHKPQTWQYVLNQKTGLIERFDRNATTKAISDDLSLPTRLDWRDNNGNWVTPVKNQENCGACWDFATVGAWESRIRIAKNNPDFVVDKSEQFILSCSSGSCDGGYYVDEDGAASFIFLFGCPDESCFPYGAPYDTRSCSEKCSDWQSSATKIHSGALISFSGSPSPDYIAAIKTALLNGPVATMFDVYDDFYSYQSGIYQYSSGSNSGGHGVVIIGWDDTTTPACWIAKNSWGESWGENGFFRIAQYEPTSEFGSFSYEILYSENPNEYELEHEDVLGEYGFGNPAVEYWWAGVEFTASDTGKITAVVTQFLDLQMSYTVEIFKGISSYGTPGELLLTQSGSFGNTLGYKRIDMDTPIEIETGDKLFVAIRYSGTTYPAPLESQYSTYNSGNSWYTESDSNSKWKRLTRYGDFKIRAIVEKKILEPGSITVISPNGGEQIECSHDITWISENVAGNVKIEFLVDSSWQSIIANAPNIGIYNWSVPDGMCLENSEIRISDIQDSLVQDVSDSPFSVDCNCLPTCRIKIAPDTSIGIPGSQLTLQIRLEKNPNIIDALGFQLNYCNDKLAFVNAVKADLTQDFNFFESSENVPGTITIGGFSPEGIPANSSGSIAELTFNVIACKTDEECLFTISETEDDLSGLSTCDGLFKCNQPCLLGDVNNDTKITVEDALCAFRIYIKGGLPESSACNNNCAIYASDANCDGKITSGDALIIFSAYSNSKEPPLTCPANEPGTSLANKSESNINLPTIRCQPDEIISIPLKLNNAKQISAFGLDFGYTADCLEFLNIEKTALTKNWEQIDANKNIDGVVTIGGFTTSPSKIEDDAVLVNVRFKVNETAAQESEIWIFNTTDDLENTKATAGKIRLLTSEVRSLDCDQKPTEYKLNQNFPNPFNPVTEIEYQLPEAANVTLMIYNSIGQRIKTLVSQHQNAGRFAVKWDATNDYQETVPSGIYFFRLETSDFVEMKKMLLIK